MESRLASSLQITSCNFSIKACINSTSSFGWWKPETSLSRLCCFSKNGGQNWPLIPIFADSFISVLREADGFDVPWKHPVILWEGSGNSRKLGRISRLVFRWYLWSIFAFTITNHFEGTTILAALLFAVSKPKFGSHIRRDKANIELFSKRSRFSRSVNSVKVRWGWRRGELASLAPTVCEKAWMAWSKSWSCF